MKRVLEPTYASAPPPNKKPATVSHDTWESFQLYYKTSANQNEPYLLFASRNGLTLIVTHLLTQCDANETTQNGITALMYAAQYKYLAIVNVLLSSGANPHLQNILGYTALMYAIIAGHMDIATCILSRMMCINQCTVVEKNRMNALQLAVYDNNYLLAKQLVRLTNLKHITANGFTALHIAAYYGHFRIVQLLVENKAKTNCLIEGPHAHTPLILAIMESKNSPNHLLVVKYLVESGKVDVNLPNAEGRTPIQIAIENNQHDVIECLLDPTRRYSKVATNATIFNLPMLSHAVVTRPEVVMHLLRLGIDLEHVCINGFTALHNACAAGDIPCAKLLIAYGANLYAESANNALPLDVACAEGQFEMVKLLLSHMEIVNVNAHCATGKTAFMLACESKRASELVPLLLEFGGDPNRIDDDSLTPVHLLARNDIPSVSALLMLIARTNIGEHYLDMLKFAILSENLNIIEIIILTLQRHMLPIMVDELKQALASCECIQVYCLSFFCSRFDAHLFSDFSEDVKEQSTILRRVIAADDAMFNTPSALLSVFDDVFSAQVHGVWAIVIAYMRSPREFLVKSIVHPDYA
jgi:ankyrin repeat protein